MVTKIVFFFVYIFIWFLCNIFEYNLVHFICLVHLDYFKAYVLREVISVGGNVLFEVMCWCGACLYDSISFYLFGLAGRHFLLDDMICLRVHIVGEHE